MQDSLPTLVLVLVVYPLWLLAGAADFLCHRRADLAHTSGVGESVLHLLMLAQLGSGMLLVLLCEITTPLLLLLAALVLLHTLTTWFDARYTLPQRRIGAFEQQVHGWLDVLPFVAVLLLALQHHSQWPWRSTADWVWQWRDPALSPLLMIGVLAPAVVLGLLPAVLELQHARRARHHEAPLSRPPPPP